VSPLPLAEAADLTSVAHQGPADVLWLRPKAIEVASDVTLASSPAPKRTPRRRARPGWPGSLLAPAPALVPVKPGRALVYDGSGQEVRVSGRLELSGDPARLMAAGEPAMEIVAWAGPWPVDERWWAPAEAHRRVRFQVALGGGTALLLSLAGGHWFVEARYD
jgi:protein ImuB